MPENPTKTARPDLDIAEDIRRVMWKYPPLSHDNHQIEFNVVNGKVTVKGYAKTTVTYQYLLNAIKIVPGVKSVSAAAFYDDERLRLRVAQVTPLGVTTQVNYGAAILSGVLPAGLPTKTLTQKVARVPGIRQVITTF